MADDQNVSRRVDVDIFANVHGSEKTISELAKLVAAQARFEKATKATSNSMKAAGNDNARFGASLQNVGFQVQDVAVQIAGGQGAIRAFSQQLPQAIGALQGMFSATSKLGAFLGGPWGVAVGVASAVLIPFVGSLFEAEEAADGAGDSIDEMAGKTERQKIAAMSLTQATDALNQATGAYNLSAQETIRLLEIQTRKTIADTKAKLGQAAAAVTAAEAQIKAIQIVQSVQLPFDPLAPSGTEQGQLAQREQAGIDRRANGLRQVAELQRDIAKGYASLAGIYAGQVKASDDASKASDRHTASTRANTKAADDNSKAWDATFKAIQSYVEELNRGNPEVAAIQATITKLNGALASNKLNAEGAAEANRQLTEANKKLIETQERIALQGDPFGEYILSINEAVRRTEKLQAELNAVNLLLEGDLPEQVRKVAEGYKAKVTDQLDPEGKPIRERAELYAAGGKGGEEAGRLQKQIEEQQKVIDQLNEMGASAKAATDDLQKMQNQLDMLKMPPALKQMVEDLSDRIEQFGDDIGKVIEGTMSLKKAFNNLAKGVVADLTKMIVKLVLVKALTAISGSLGGQVGAIVGVAKGGVFQGGNQLEAYAKGAAFMHGQLQKFANGGIVTGPTLFPMANGTGLMGEAGPEAVMPLTRGPDGKLGVTATTVQPVVNIYNQAPGVTVRTETDRAGELSIFVEAARKTIAEDIRRGGTMVARSIEGTYGASRTGRG